jgi:hypothetical protein
MAFAEPYTYDFLSEWLDCCFPWLCLETGTRRGTE